MAKTRFNKLNRLGDESLAKVDNAYPEIRNYKLPIKNGIDCRINLVETRGI